MKKLEWHDRRQTDEGRFARRDYSHRINIRCNADFADEVRRRAMAAEMEISQFIVTELVQHWTDTATKREKLGALKRYAPKIFAAAMFDADTSNLMALYDKDRGERMRIRRDGRRVTVDWRGSKPPWERSSQQAQ